MQAVNNNSSLSEESTVGAFTSDSNQRFLTIISYLLLFIGIGAFFANGTIFLLLLRKQNKLASELLVLGNLLIDALYGLTLFSVGFCNVNNVYLAEITGYLPLQCIIRRVPYTFLVLASLCLLIVMTLNRYVAVKIPFRYKILFKIANVIKYLVAITTISTLFATLDLVMCITDPYEQAIYSEMFTIVWIYLKVFLIGTVTILMFIMYKSISNQFVGNFWAPIWLPFRALFECEFRCHEQDDIASVAPSHGEDYANENQPISVYEHESDEPTSQKPPTVKKLSLAIEMQNVGTGENGSQSKLGRDTREHKSSLDIKLCGKMSLQASPAFEKRIGSDNSPSRRAISSKRKTDQKALMEQKRQQKKHHLTTMFFFISVMFIMVSAPNSIGQVISHLFPELLSLIFQWRLYLLTETLYGLNFLLNPYLYSFNNSYIKQKFGETFENLKKKKKEKEGDKLSNQTKTPRSSATGLTKTDTRRPSKAIKIRMDDYEV